MDNGKNLNERVALELERLSPKQKQLARFILEHPYLVSYATAGQVGEAAGTSAATVVRFAQSLGYGGYTELQDDLRAEMPSYRTAMERFQDYLDAPASLERSPQQNFHTDIRNIERTAAGLSEENLQIAVETILEAKSVLVVGAGLSATPAFFLAYSLRLIGVEARPVVNDSLLLVTEMSQIGKGEVLVAIDFWRYVRSTLAAVQAARARGAFTIAFSDGVISPLTGQADLAFEVATEGLPHSRSITGLVSLLNVLVAAISYQDPQRAMKALQRVDRAYRESDLLLTE